jgi:integrase
MGSAQTSHPLARSCCWKRRNSPSRDQSVGVFRLSDFSKSRSGADQDFGLVFAKEAPDLQTPQARLCQPIVTLSGRRFQALVKEADVKRIKFHGCRHTVATLSLAAGTPPHVVASRLGHSVLELMRTYAHALPDQQQDAATRLGKLLHG